MRARFCFVIGVSVLKILYFLKGVAMKIQFSKARLSRAQKKSLLEVLNVLQSQNKNELEVTAVEFPLKLMVKLDDDIGMLLGWDVEKQSYAGLTTPEPTEESQQELAGLGKAQENFAGQEPLPEPEPELDLSPVFERAEALARVLVNLSKPLNTEQRIEVWMKFCVVLAKELWK